MPRQTFIVLDIEYGLVSFDSKQGPVTVSCELGKTERISKPADEL